MPTKIIRTIIGFPLSLVLWPIAIIVASFQLLIAFIVDGSVDDYDKEIFAESSLLPIFVLRSIWK